MRKEIKYENKPMLIGYDQYMSRNTLDWDFYMVNNEDDFKKAMTSILVLMYKHYWDSDKNLVPSTEEEIRRSLLDGLTESDRIILDIGENTPDDLNDDMRNQYNKIKNNLEEKIKNKVKSEEEYFFILQTITRVIEALDDGWHIVDENGDHLATRILNEMDSDDQIHILPLMDPSVSYALSQL